MYICFDLGGTAIKAGITDTQGRLLARETVPTRVADGQEGIFSQLGEIKKSLLKKTGLKERDLTGAGIGIPGFVVNSDFVLKAPNLGWENSHVKDSLERQLGLPVLVVNDANAAALGEMWQGAGEDCTNLLCLTLGTGIGAGVIVDGKIHTGTRGLAGEIGHLKVKSTGGRYCNCGGTGCLETESSGRALAYYGEQAVKQKKRTKLTGLMMQKGGLSARDIVEAAREGDPVAVDIIHHGAQYLGLALANIYLVLAPQKIILGGGVAGAGDLLFKPVVSRFNHYALAGISGEELIVPARLGNLAGLKGLTYLLQQNLGLQ